MCVHTRVCLCVLVPKCACVCKHVCACVCACVCVCSGHNRLPNRRAHLGYLKHGVGLDLEHHSYGRHSIYTPVCRDVQRERHLRAGEVRKYVGFFAFLRIFPFPIWAPLPGSIAVFRFLFLPEGDNTAGIASYLPARPPWASHRASWPGALPGAEQKLRTQSGEQQAFTPPALALPSALPAHPLLSPQLWDSDYIFCFASFLPTPSSSLAEPGSTVSVCDLGGCGGQRTLWPCSGSSTF